MHYDCVCALVGALLWVAFVRKRNEYRPAPIFCLVPYCSQSSRVCLKLYQLLLLRSFPTAQWASYPYVIVMVGVLARILFCCPGGCCQFLHPGFHTAFLNTSPISCGYPHSLSMGFPHCRRRQQICGSSLSQQILLDPTAFFDFLSFSISRHLLSSKALLIL